MREAISGFQLVPIPAYRLAHAGYLPPLLPADLPAAQGQIAARSMRPIGTTGKSAKAVQPRAQKYSA
jgi:hypothetical protein